MSTSRKAGQGSKCEGLEWDGRAAQLFACEGGYGEVQICVTDESKEKEGRCKWPSGPIAGGSDRKRWGARLLKTVDTAAEGLPSHRLQPPIAYLHFSVCVCVVVLFFFLCGFLLCVFWFVV